MNDHRPHSIPEMVLGFMSAAILVGLLMHFVAPGVLVP